VQPGEATRGGKSREGEEAKSGEINRHKPFMKSRESTKDGLQGAQKREDYISVGRQVRLKENQRERGHLVKGFNWTAVNQILSKENKNKGSFQDRKRKNTRQKRRSPGRQQGRIVHIGG